MVVTNFVFVTPKKVITLSIYSSLDIKQQTRYCCTEQFLEVASIQACWISSGEFDSRLFELRRDCLNYTLQTFKTE